MFSPEMFAPVIAEKRILFFKFRISFGSAWQAEQAEALVGAGLTEEQASFAVTLVMREVRRVLERI
jgi:hypothetical protein